MSDRDTLTLPSGKEIYAHCGLVGLNPEFEVSEGYDGMIYARADFGNEYDDFALTPAEMVELADIMIARWQAFRATQLPPDADAPQPQQAAAA